MCFCSVLQYNQPMWKEHAPTVPAATLPYLRFGIATSKTRCTLLPASHCTIDNCCVDYVSITHGDSTREHICMDVCSWSNCQYPAVCVAPRKYVLYAYMTHCWMDGLSVDFQGMLWSPKFSHCSANRAKLATCLWYSHWTFIHSFTVWKVRKACSKYIQVAMQASDECLEA